MPESMTPSFADVAAMTRNENGFGGDNLILILLFILFANGGFGYNNRGGVQNDYVLTSDFATLERKADGLANGISDATFALNNGQNGINYNVQQNGYETRLGINELGGKMAQCCCDLKSTIADAVYNSAKQHCETMHEIDNARDSIIAKLNDQEMQRLRDENARLYMEQSQCAQNTYLVNMLRPSPVPAYQVQNPYATGYLPCNC